MGYQHSAALLLASVAAVVAVTAAAGVTHGDIILYNYPSQDQPVEFRSPEGALKLKFAAQTYGISYTTGAAVSADGRYAVVLGQTVANFFSGTPVAVFVQLGANTKVLGVRALPSLAETKAAGCSGSFSAAALRSSVNSKGATVLTMYQFMGCSANSKTGSTTSTQFVGQWSVPMSKAGKLGAMTSGPRVPYKPKFNVEGVSIALVNGRVYVSVSLARLTTNDRIPHGVNIYELVTSAVKAGAGKRLVAALKFKYFTKVAVGPNGKPILVQGFPGIFKLVPTSAVSGFAVTNTLAADKIYYAAKGQRTLVGGLPTAISYRGITALGSTAYALINQGKVSPSGPSIVDEFTYIYKVSAAELRAKAKGRVLFKVPGSFSYAGITVVP